MDSAKRYQLSIYAPSVGSEVTRFGSEWFSQAKAAVEARDGVAQSRGRRLPISNRSCECECGLFVGTSSVRSDPCTFDEENRRSAVPVRVGPLFRE